MKAWPVVLLGLLACSTPQRAGEAANGRSGPAEFRPSGIPELDDAQLECRSSTFDFIAARADLLGAMCDRPMLALALTTFDTGTIAGFGEASKLLQWRLSWCICRTTSCPDDTFVEMADRFRDLQENDGRAEREGVMNVTNRLADHRCIKAALSVDLFKAGYNCGYVRGLSSPIMRKDLENTVETILPADPTARTRARECWDSLGPDSMAR